MPPTTSRLDSQDARLRAALKSALTPKATGAPADAFETGEQRFYRAFLAAMQTLAPAQAWVAASKKTGIAGGEGARRAPAVGAPQDEVLLFAGCHAARGRVMGLLEGARS